MDLQLDATTAAAIISAIASVAVAVITTSMVRRNKRTDEWRAARESRDKALYRSVFAMMDGMEVLLRQAHGDHLNGNVDAALKCLENARGEFDEVTTSTLVNL